MFEQNNCPFVEPIADLYSEMRINLSLISIHRIGQTFPSKLNQHSEIDLLQNSYKL